MGNAAESGSGGGLRLQQRQRERSVDQLPTHDRSEPVVRGPLVTNNIITNNVAGWDGGGISLQDALAVNIINNTIVSNDTTASSGVLFNALFAPGQRKDHARVARSANYFPGLTDLDGAGRRSHEQPEQRDPEGESWVPDRRLSSGHCTGASAVNGTCRRYSYPFLYNDIFWQNRAFYIGVGRFGTGTRTSNTWCPV